MAGLKLTPQDAVRRLQRLVFLRDQAVTRVLTESMRFGRDRAVNHYMVRQPLGALPLPDKLTHRSGRLGRSTKIIAPRRTGGTWTAGLQAGGLNVRYARIHEYGGRTAGHLIAPVKAAVLRWYGTGPSLPGKAGGRKGKGVAADAPPGGGFPIFSRVVHHPGSRIPARPRIGPALADAFARIKARLSPELLEVRRQVFG